MKITKSLDLSSPRLNQALASSEVLSEVRLLSYRIDETGHEEHYFTRILENARKNIKADGYQPKYTDEELMDMAQNGNVGDERFQVRFMAASHLQHRDTPNIPCDRYGKSQTHAALKAFPPPSKRSVNLPIQSCLWIFRKSLPMWP